MQSDCGCGHFLDHKKREPSLVRVLAVGLAIAAFWPLIGAFAWFGVNIATLEQLSRADPFGLRIFPAALMFVQPAVAAIAAISVLCAAWIVGASHPLRASRAFLNIAGTQALVAVILIISGPPINGTLTRLLPMFENRRTPGALVQPGHFVLLQTAARNSIVRQLFGIAVGCMAAALIARFVTRKRSLERSAERLALEAAPIVEGVAVAPASLPTSGARHLKQDSYDVRPSVGRWAGVLRHDNHYNIRAVAHAKSNQEAFSYSMKEGVLRREPDGETLLSLTTREGAPGFAYSVSDPSRRLAAVFVYRDNGWEIRDPQGHTLADVTRELDDAGAALYVARSADVEVCRYTWSTGAGPMNPVLLVDFASGTTFDRALAIALAPYLEEEARLRSAKRFRYQ